MNNKISINLKKIISSMLMSLVVFSSLSIGSTAEAITPIMPTLTIGSQTAANGANISVPITASNFGNVIAGMTLDVQYDNTLLTYTGYTQNDISGHGTLAISAPASNPIGINWFDSSSLELHTNTLLTLNFTVISGATIGTNLTFAGAKEISDETANTISTNFINGIISLNSDTTPPTISYTLSDIIISPNNDGVKDSSTIDIAYSEEVNADINILDDGGVKVRDLYNSTAVTNPTAKIWGGKNNSNQVVVDGIYTIQILGTDPAGNTVSDTSRTITVDTIAPVITLSGSSPVDITVGNSYTDAGASASDNIDGNITANLVIINPVNVNTVGIYTITYNVSDTAGNPATQVTRTVNVNAVPLSSDKDITSFSFAGLGSGVISGSNIAVGVPFGTDVTALIPTITLSGGTVVPSSGTANNFTNPVVYTVTAEDGSTQAYTITVTIAPNTEANILSFNSTAPVANGVISGNNITLTVPFGTSLVDLPITITLSSGASVVPIAGNTTFADGVAVTYTVTAQDALTTQDYLVSVNIAPNTAKDITSFNFSGLVPSVTGIISGTNITLNVPYGTDVTALVPTIGITGASINPASGNSQDFTNPVTYTVTAADSSTQDYLVNVIVAAPSDLTALTAAITAAQAKHDAAIEGNLAGQYPAPLKANLQTAINVASAITNADTQTVVDAAVITLNSAVATFEAGVVLPDITAPIITLIGAATVDITVGETFTDLGATATDDRDGSIAVTQSGLVDINVVGTYIITYTATDAAGNIARVTRVVNVHPSLAGIAITTPADKLVYTVGDTLDITGLVITGTYSDASTKVEVITLANITGFDSSAVVNDQVLTITVGGKTTTYTIDVVAPADTTKPVITLLGSGTVNLYVGDTYSDAGATATDNVDGDITSRIVTVNTVNTAVVGSYTITYNVSDVAGNAAAEVTRTVNVTVRPSPSSGGGGGGGSSSYHAPAFNSPAIGGFSVIINGGATETNSTDVKLTLNGGTATRMAISSSSDFSNTSQETYQTSKDWTLLDGVGQKTVYVKFFDQNGTASPVVSATVKLVNELISAPSVSPSPTTGQVLGVKIKLIDSLITTTKFGTRSNDVKLLQGELKKAGFYPANWDLTGYYGPVTKAGVEKYLASIKNESASNQVLGVKIKLIDSLIATTKFGTRSNDVKLLQGELKKAGFYPANWDLTGYYGPVTKAGVEKYLASIKNESASNQVLGVKTKLIDSLIATTKFGTRSNDVKLLQGELKKAGFYPANWDLTGYYGPVTKAGVEKYLASIN